MIETKEGTKLEFKKLDEWVIELTVSIKNDGPYIEVATAVMTIQDLISEINRLQRSHPGKPT